MEGPDGQPTGWWMPSDYERLIKLEQLILSSVDIARQVCEEMAQKTEHDNSKLLRLCSGFTENIRLAQMLTLEATQKHRYLEPQHSNIYREMNLGQLFVDRAETMQSLLNEMERCLKEPTPND